MTKSDDRRRAAGIREASRLRAVMGSEPSSGYAFHDRVRAERFERARPASAGRTEKSEGSQERPFARTLLGSAAVEDLLGSARAADNVADAGEERVNLHSLPPIPNDLAGSADEVAVEGPAREMATEAHATGAEATGRAPGESMGPAGGAIWQAMPSLVEAAGDASADSGEAADEAHDPADAAASSGMLTFAAAEPLSSGRSPAYRPSAAELEAEHRHAYADPRVLKYEALVERNAWEQISDELSRETALSPALCLLHIVARRESLKSDPKETAKLTEQAISTIARILQVPEASPTALVISKRLLRRNPGWNHQKQASTGLSLSIMLFGIAAGGGIGWLVTKLLL